ncbi:Sulfate permease 2 [Basidiobolus ranarum]|uniref:Sulfate permease 2 n=1 Tax=Basidiobolus ranarum TaxID=34480 RepID=A0ABR2VUR2_9FUNG
MSISTTSSTRKSSKILSKIPIRKFATQLKNTVPILQWLPKYNRSWLIGDLISGIAVGVAVLPQSIAIAQVAGIPVQHGLYSSTFGTMAYSIFGTSKDALIGPTSVGSLLTRQTINEITGYPDNTFTPTEIAITAGFLSSFIIMGLGIFRLGIVLSFISAPVIIGYTSGAAVYTFFLQLPSMLGIEIEIHHLQPYEKIATVLSSLPKARVSDAMVGIASSIFLIGMSQIYQRYHARSIWAKYLGMGRNTLLIFFATLIFYIVHIVTGSIPVTVVDNIPNGLPPPKSPPLDLALYSKLFASVVVMSLLAVMEHIGMCKTLGPKNGYTADGNQEFIALGFSNFLGSFFNGYITSSGLTRAMISSQSGSKTPLMSTFAALIVIGGSYVLPPAFKFTPNATISAIIGVNILEAFKGPKVYLEFWKIQKTDCIASLLALVITICFGMKIGIIVPAAFTVLTMMLRIARPKWETFDVEEKETVKNRLDIGEFKPPPGVIIFRWKESILFTNAEYFKDKLRKVTYENTRPFNVIKPEHKSWSEYVGKRAMLNRVNRSRMPTLCGIVLDLSAVNRIDFSGVKALVDIKLEFSTYAGNSEFPFYFVHANGEVERALSTSKILCPPDMILVEEESVNDKEVEQEFQTLKPNTTLFTNLLEPLATLHHEPIDHNLPENQ